MAVSPHPPTVDADSASAFWRLTGDLFVVADATGVILEVNPACLPLLGVSEHALLGVPVLTLLHPDDEDRVRTGLATPWPPSDFEARVRHADGSHRRLSCSAERRGERWCVVARATGDGRANGRPHVVGRDEGRSLHQDALDVTQGESVVLDASGRILYTGQSWGDFARSQGFTDEGCGRGVDYLSVCDRAGRDDAIAADVGAGLRELLDGRRERFDLEYPCKTPTETRWFALHARRYHGDGPARAVVRHKDVTEHRRDQHDARLQSRLMAQIDAAVVATDTNLLVTHLNPAAERMFGWTHEEAIGRPVNETVMSQTVVHPDATRRLAGGKAWELDFTGRRRDGETFPIAARVATIEDGRGHVSGYVGVLSDQTARLAIERDLRGARDHLRAVTASMGEGLCVLDRSDRLTYLNPAAEQLLGWTFLELEGESFHAVVHFRRADGTANPAADCPILRCISDGREVRVEEDSFVRRDGSDLPVSYVAAPFETEQGVAGTVLVFSDATERLAVRRSMERELQTLGSLGRIRAALDEDRFVLHAQPIVDLATGATVQHELLIRMLDAEGGLVPPGAFLPAAEESGMITEIDRWVISEAVVLAAEGHALHVNLSAPSVGDPTLPAFLREQLARCGADPSRLVIELTETAVLADEDAAAAFITEVKALGCKLALDDFGTGYGGFTYLKRLPVDCLKIDMEFVRDLVVNPASEHVVRAVVNLASDFGHETVAEGVEDETTLDMLRSLGVTYAQGYHTGRPGPAHLVLDAARDQGAA